MSVLKTYLTKYGLLKVKYRTGSQVCHEVSQTAVFGVVGLADADLHGGGEKAAS